MTSLNAIRNPASDSIKPATPQPSTATAAPNNLANQTTFLQLLVAQLKYQDPLQPQDGTAFVTQLAQFSTLEQQIGSHQDLAAIRQLLTEAAATRTAPAAPANMTAKSGVPAA